MPLLMGWGASNLSIPTTAVGETTYKSKACTMKGFMNKRGEINKSWKRRYFKLVGHELLYFEGPSVRHPPILSSCPLCRFVVWWLLMSLS